MTRSTCEGCISLDVRDLHREGFLLPGQTAHVKWLEGDETVGEIGIKAREGVVFLVYRVRRGKAKSQPIRQPVPITWTSCHLGGRRPWFICAAHVGERLCGRRVAKLYVAGPGFACRHCHDLIYACQQEGPVHRNIRQARKIREGLGGDPSLLDPFPDKPSGMHWRTYDRLRQRAEAAEQRSYAPLWRHLGRLTRRRPRWG
jgi:hypothetical protein